MGDIDGRRGRLVLVVQDVGIERAGDRRLLQQEARIMRRKPSSAVFAARAFSTKRVEVRAGDRLARCAG